MLAQIHLLLQVSHKVVMFTAQGEEARLRHCRRRLTVHVEEFGTLI